MLQWKHSVKHSDIFDYVDKVSYGIRSVTVTSHNVTLYDIFDCVDKVSFGIRSVTVTSHNVTVYDIFDLTDTCRNGRRSVPVLLDGAFFVSICTCYNENGSMLSRE